MDTGSFGAAAGGLSPELQASIQRRATGGATSAVTQGSPNFDPSTQPPAPPTGGAPLPQQGQPLPTAQPGVPQDPMAQQMQSNAQTAGLPFDTTESRIIINALTNRGKALSDMQKSVVDSMVGKPPQIG